MKLEISPSVMDGQRNHLERLPTNTLSHHNRVQRWANFIAGYSVEFVENCLSEVQHEDGLIIDPFMGCGTTLVAARNLGLDAVGFDRHPVFYNLASAKLRVHTVDELLSVASSLQSASAGVAWSSDATTFLQKMFATEELGHINAASAVIPSLPLTLQPLATLIFLRACERTCGAQTDGIYKAPSSIKRSIPFKTALESVVGELQADIESTWYAEHWSQQPDPTIYNKSSVSMDELAPASVAACVTSPPYLNNFDYAEMTRMQLYLLGWASSWREISDKLRNDLITNTTTALRGKKGKEYQERTRSDIPGDLVHELDGLVLRLRAERAVRAGKKDYDYLIYPYYHEMRGVLANLYRAMKPKSSIDWVVADAALYGVHIKTHIHTSRLMTEIGFSDISITKMRSRGTRWVLNKRDGAEEGLGEFHIRAFKGE